VSDKQDYDRLTAELKFRLPAVEVRAPAIFPGGSRAGGLASIAEASGFAAGGLAGAVINFFGMLWPGPRRLRVRVWIEPRTSNDENPTVCRVSVHLDDPQTGMSIATKTLAAKDIDEAAAMVAGYVARYIFAGDRTAPPWCTGAADGRDLAALLLARQERDYPESEELVCRARHRQIRFLEGVTRSPQCAGATRYELAQLYDLTGRHVEALLMHAINRDQFPHFYRGRYRLAMSLEMIANACTSVAISTAKDVDKFNKALKILWMCGVLENKPPTLEHPCSVNDGLPPEFRSPLLKAAWKELLAIRWYLSLPSIAWHSFWRHDERAILRPYWRQSYRQAFLDGVGAALLLVAVRRAEVDSDCGKHWLRGARTILRVAAAITGDDAALAEALRVRRLPQFLRLDRLTPVLRIRKARRAKGQPRPVTKTLRTRHWLRPYSTRSWQAGYNLACAYAAVMQTLLAEYAAKREWDERKLQNLTRLMVNSLEFTVCNPACEMERPGDWIGNDPDFSFLHPDENSGKTLTEKEQTAFTDFTAFLRTQRLRDYPFVPPAQAALEEQLACPMSGSRRPLAGPAEAEDPVAHLV
jgi:hypothetical protein